MDLRSVLSLSLLTFSSWNLAHSQVPSACSQLPLTFRDPSTYLQHHCSLVCDFVRPALSPFDCSEQCPELWKCLINNREEQQINAVDPEPRHARLRGNAPSREQSPGNRTEQANTNKTTPLGENPTLEPKLEPTVQPAVGNFQDPRMIFILCGVLSFVAALALLLFGILVWRCCREPKRMIHSRRPSEEEGLVDAMTKPSPDVVLDHV